jgi:LytS/YehU family sensor histidine kinase
VISRIACLLRHSIDLDDNQIVTVENELDTIQNYLAIEEIRFKDRLKLEMVINPSVRKTVIYGLILYSYLKLSTGLAVAAFLQKNQEFFLLLSTFLSV